MFIDGDWGVCWRNIGCYKKKKKSGNEIINFCLKMSNRDRKGWKQVILEEADVFRSILLFLNIKCFVLKPTFCFCKLHQINIVFFFFFGFPAFTNSDSILNEEQVLFSLKTLAVILVILWRLVQIRIDNFFHRYLSFKYVLKQQQ